MKKSTKYILIFILTFILYGNTLFNDYTLDDSLVITENEYTLSGFKGIRNLLSEDSFNGFFDQKDKKLVSGGRYRPLSMITFAAEWQFIMGTPFDGISLVSLKRKMNSGANPKFILPSQKLLKDLSKTIHIENRKSRTQQQESILKNEKALNDSERTIILSKLEKMHSRRSLLLFVSHFLNVLFYALTVLILFFLLERVFKKYKSDKWYLSIPFIASLLFLAHPIHTEVVANIKGRDEILSLLGALLALFFVIKYIDQHKLYYLFLGFFSFLFALFSKEVAITFLAIIPFSIYFFIEREKKLKAIIVSIVPLFIASVIYFYVRGNVIGGMSFEPSLELMNNSFLGMTFIEKYATIFYTLIVYIKLLIFPHPLTYDYYPYHISIMTWSDIRVILSLIIHTGIGLYALFGLKGKKIISFGIIFYLIAISPMSNILFPIGVFMNERFVYAASIGFVIILAYLISNKFPVWVKRTPLVSAVFILIFALYSVKTISRNRIWENDFTLFTNDVNISENSAKSNTSAGGKLIEEATKPENENLKIEYLDKAIFYLHRAIKIHPDYNEALLLMGNAQWERHNNIDSLFKYYHQILIKYPNYEQVYSNIFNTKVNLIFDKPSNADQNLRVLHELEKFNANNFNTNYYLGRIYGRYKNNLITSIQYLERAAKIKPESIMVYKDLGVAYGMLGRFDESAIVLTKAVSLDPQDPALRINLAMTHANLKNYPEALKVMESIFNMDFDSKNAFVLVNLGSMYRDMGELEKAQQCFNKAKQLNPDLFKNVKQ